VPAITTSGDGVSEPFDFEVRPDQSTAAPLPAAAFPVLVTFAQLGAHVALDATPREEACAAGRLHVAVTPAGAVAAMHKAGAGGIHPANLLDLLARAQVCVCVLSVNKSA
jgi:exosome complex RNA-binding protein Rrp42 (RNase PH superfamily)